MTIPGAGGQVPPRADQLVQPAQPVPVSPGGSQIARVTQIIVTPGGVLEGIFTYSSNPPAAGTLIESASVQAAGTDKYGNHFVAGHASYAGGFATSLNGGFVQFYTGSLAGGWSATGSITTDSPGDILILAAAGRSVLTNNQTLDDGSGNMSVSGGLTVGGTNQTSTATGNPATSGPNGGVFAGHTHFFAGHTHTL